METSLQIIHDLATENVGSLCLLKSYRPLQIALNAERYEGTRQKADLAAVVLQDVGVNRHGGKQFNLLRYCDRTTFKLTSIFFFLNFKMFVTKLNIENQMSDFSFSGKLHCVLTREEQTRIKSIKKQFYLN